MTEVAFYNLIGSICFEPLAELLAIWNIRVCQTSRGYFSKLCKYDFLVLLFVIKVMVDMLLWITYQQINHGGVLWINMRQNPTIRFRNDPSKWLWCISRLQWKNIVHFTPFKWLLGQLSFPETFASSKTEARSKRLRSALTFSCNKTPWTRARPASILGRKKSFEATNKMAANWSNH